MTFEKDDCLSDGRMTITDKDASGIVIMVDDAYPTPHTINKTTVFGKSDQVTTKGVNLFDATKVKSVTLNGITMTVNPDSSITISGTNTAETVNNFDLRAGFGGKDITYPTGSYTATAEGLNLASLIIQLKDATYVTATKAKPTTVVNNKSEQTLTYFLISVPKGATVNETIKVWFEKGSKSLKEPYTGGKPSPSPEFPQEITNLNKAEIVVTGKNLINADGAKKSGWNILLPKMNLIHGVTYSFTAPRCKQTCSIYAKASNTRLVSFLKSGQTQRFTVPNNTDFSEGCFIAGGSADSLEDMNTVLNTVMVEVGTVAGTYSAPKQLTSTPIDLKGNELCSLPNGVKDEVVIDSEGNVSLIKRVASIDCKNLTMDRLQRQANGKWVAYRRIPGVSGDWQESGAKSNKLLHKTSLVDASEFGSFIVGDSGNLCLGLPENLYPQTSSSGLEVTPEVAAWFDEFKQDLVIHVRTTNHQTIPLGKVEALMLKNTVQTIYSNTNIPTIMNINYKSYLQEDTMAEKKYLDLAGLTGYDAKIKAAIDAKDAATLQGAKAYADSLGANYDAAGSATTAKTQAVQEAKGYTDSEIAKVNTKVGEVEKKAQQGVTDAATAKAAADKAQGEVDALETLVGTLPEDAGATTVVAYVDKKTEGMASDALLKQLQTTVGQHTTDISGLKEKDTALQGAVDKAQGAATANKATIDQLIGTDKGKSVRAIANEELAAQLIPEAADETLNTLKEIADWIQKHPNDAAAMNSAIEKLKTLIGTIPTEGVTAKDITGYIAEVKAALEKSVAAEKSRAEGAEAGLGGRITTLEGKAHTHANADVLNGITAGKVSKWDGAATNSHIHANKAVLDGISSAKVSAWDAAEANAKAYADGKVAEFVAITPQEIEELFAAAPGA